MGPTKGQPGDLHQYFCGVAARAHRLLMGVGTQQHAEQIKPGNVIASAGRGEAVPQGNAAFHGIIKASNGYCNCAYFESSTMSDKFKRLDANERAALESTLYRCRALVGWIGEELRKKEPEHFVDERSLADFHASLEHAASVLEQTIQDNTPTSTAKGLQEGSRQRHR
jgi:hypothetical protein